MAPSLVANRSLQGYLCGSTLSNVNHTKPQLQCSCFEPYVTPYSPFHTKQSIFIYGSVSSKLLHESCQTTLANILSSLTHNNFHHQTTILVLQYLGDNQGACLITLGSTQQATTTNLIRNEGFIVYQRTSHSPNKKKLPTYQVRGSIHLRLREPD